MKRKNKTIIFDYLAKMPHNNWQGFLKIKLIFNSLFNPIAMAKWKHNKRRFYLKLKPLFS